MEAILNYAWNLVTYCVVEYGYAGLFCLLVLGIVGLPVPDETLLAFAGYLVWTGEMNGPLALATAIAGSICGISLSYVLGCTLGHWLIVRYGPWIGITAERLEKVHVWFEHYGKWTLVFGYFIPGIRQVAAYVAGMTGMRYKPFALYAYTGGVIWGVLFVSLGYFLGRSWSIVRDVLGSSHAIELGLIAVAIVLYTILAKLRKRRRQQEQLACPK